MRAPQAVASCQKRPVYTQHMSHTLTRVTSGALIALFTASLLTGCGGRQRPIQTSDELLAERKVLQQEVMTANLDGLEALVKHVHGERTTDPNDDVDVLVISGGGDWGAFGTGVLTGWGELPDTTKRRPEFDVVSGVSTGALIAPFAFLGTNADIKTIDDLYRNPKEDWVKTRGLLFFLPENASFAEVPGLEREVDKFITMDVAKRVAAATQSGRMVYVNTTNLDDGNAQPFRWGLAAERAVKDGDLTRLRNILLASSGIPGAFPPREIDGSIYCDGAVTSNIIYGGVAKRDQTFGAIWKRTYPNEPIPTIRFWVILNNYAVSQPRTVQPSWPSVIERSLEVAVRSSTNTALRHLMAMAELSKLTGNGNIEVRWIAIPNSWDAPEPGIFKEATMRSLSDLGRKMGGDLSNWHSEAP